MEIQWNIFTAIVMRVQSCNRLQVRNFQLKIYKYVRDELMIQFGNWHNLLLAMNTFDVLILENIDHIA